MNPQSQAMLATQAEKGFEAWSLHAQTRQAQAIHEREFKQNNDFHNLEFAQNEAFHMEELEREAEQHMQVLT